MAIRTYNNGAWEDTADLQCPEVNGAREEADKALTYVNGAWEEAWTAIQWMRQLENTMTVASGGISTSGPEQLGWSIYSNEGEGGYATYYLEGDFTNPSVSFDYYGIFSYELSTGATQYATCGNVYLYTRTVSGVENYIDVASLGNASGAVEDTYEKVLSGNYNRIGFKVKFNNWSVTNPMYWTTIENFFIDGKECIPSEEYEFNMN